MIVLGMSATLIAAVTAAAISSLLVIDFCRRGVAQKPF